MITEASELGYLAAPDAGGPGVVVIHDVWGLYDHFRDLSRRLADAGFVALAVDLYRGLSGAPRPDDPGAWMRELSDPDVLARVQAAVDHLHAHPAVAGRPVGVTGFCMGGSFALLSGARVRGVAAVAPFYGILSYRHGLYASAEPLDPRKKPVEPLEAARSLRCPMLACFGAEDTLIPQSDVRELEARVAGSAHRAEVVVYPGAGHAFVNDTRPTMYRPEPARQAWQRMVDFFRGELGAGGAG
jgi:carboxymethylenebutenolidase